MEQINCFSPVHAQGLSCPVEWDMVCLCLLTPFMPLNLNDATNTGSGTATSVNLSLFYSSQFICERRIERKSRKAAELAIGDDKVDVVLRGR